MPRMKYNRIYEDLKQKIERGVYRTNTYLPSEYSLIKEYDCSRNTVRRAIEQLGRDGYIQSMHGKGVIVIYRKSEANVFSFDVIESSSIVSMNSSKGLTSRLATI